MKTLEAFNNRHTDIKCRLDETANKKIPSGKMMDACKIISEMLDTSQQTVYNYINGSIKDGYLAEAILSELKRLKL